MPPPHPTEDVRAEIDDHLAAAFDAGGGDVLGATVPEPSDRDDRWYGRFLPITPETDVFDRLSR